MRTNYFNKPTVKRFVDAFPEFKDETNTHTYFYEAWLKSPFYIPEITEQQMKDCYYRLMARFYNWHFIYLDDLGITLNVFKIVADYYPNVLVRLDILKELRGLSLEDFKSSGISISSSGQNPKIATQMSELIDLVDSQTASFTLKSQEQVLRAKFNSLYDGIFDDFLDKFQDIFVKLFNGLTDYIYENEIENEEE